MPPKANPLTNCVSWWYDPASITTTDINDLPPVQPLPYGWTGPTDNGDDDEQLDTTENSCTASNEVLNLPAESTLDTSLFNVAVDNDNLVSSANPFPLTTTTATTAKEAQAQIISCKHSTSLQFIQTQSGVNASTVYEFGSRSCACQIMLTREQVERCWPRKGRALLEKIDQNKNINRPDKSFTVIR